MKKLSMKDSANPIYHQSCITYRASGIQPGFTLLEVLVAVAILGSAVAVLLGAVNRNLILASESKNVAVAGMLAEKKLTEIQLEGFPEIREESGEFAESPGFKWILSITPFEIAQIEAEIRIVNLIITWDEGRRNFEISLALSDLG